MGYIKCHKHAVYVFKNASLFDQPLDNWDVSNVDNMYPNVLARIII